METKDLKKSIRANYDKIMGLLQEEEKLLVAFVAEHDNEVKLNTGKIGRAYATFTIESDGSTESTEIGKLGIIAGHLAVLPLDCDEEDEEQWLSVMDECDVSSTILSIVEALPLFASPIMA